MAEKNTIKLKVDSSNIENIYYYKLDQKLVVTFKNGSQYKYEEVPESTFTELRNAESKGTFFSDNIKGKYEYYKIKSKTKRDTEYKLNSNNLK